MVVLVCCDDNDDDGDGPNCDDGDDGRPRHGGGYGDFESLMATVEANRPWIEFSTHCCHHHYLSPSPTIDDPQRVMFGNHSQRGW
jgi:hypothetical protein